MQNIRLDHESPESIEKWGWKYHHLGIPTNQKMPGERYMAQYKFYVSGFNTSPFGIEWMRFEDNSPVSELIRTVPHIAFEVDDLDKALNEHDFEIIAEPGAPSEGIRTAMIKHNGAPIELMEFEKNMYYEAIRCVDN
jgi:hypothetical protein